MRLSKRIIDLIKKSLKSSFGEVDVYLFGSRVDDTKRGGDIDIAIDVKLSKDDFREKKIKFITSMLRLGFDLKIDIVQYKQDDSLFFNEIDKNSVKIA
ncbi:MAG: nucleotidyltransferase domain-containing protein [Campylobacterota bacterium]|nr:nucleotidyltransferase domain-containing protein [Campylobacterota bacterium]